MVKKRVVVKVLVELEKLSVLLDVLRVRPEFCDTVP